MIKLLCLTLAFAWAALFLAACQPDGGCTNSITGSDNSVTQACGGSGDHAAATVTTPAPVVVPPVVITPVVPEGGGA